MKILALLFSVYVLYLISIPCKDGENCTYDVHTGPVSHHDQPDNHDLPDGCSPFCICSCCSVTVILTDFHFESSHSYTQVEVNIPLKQELYSDYFQHIWQPPKLMC
jgi:hypothetical protein